MTPAPSHIEEAERLACPFCEKNDTVMLRTEASDFWVHCEDCDTSGPWASSEAEAIARWNVRPAIAQALADRDDKLAQAGVRIEALKVALKPFADLADAYDDRPRPYSDTELIWCNHATVGQLRKARAALNQDGETK